MIQKNKTNNTLFIPYVAPYFLYILISVLLGDYLSIEWIYTLRIILVPLLLFWFWKFRGSYCSSTSGDVLCKGIFVSKIVIWGVVGGITGCLIWVLLLMPFAASNVSTDTVPWNTIAFILRLITASLIVPVFEELLMRGYVFRFAYQWNEEHQKNKKEYKKGNIDALNTVLDHSSIHDVHPGAWSMPAVVISTLVFAMGHHMYEWPAAIVYGLIMAFLLIKTKSIISCFVAHGTTNFILGLYVFYSGKWFLW